MCEQGRLRNVAELRNYRRHRIDRKDWGAIIRPSAPTEALGGESSSTNGLAVPVKSAAAARANGNRRTEVAHRHDDGEIAADDLGVTAAEDKFRTPGRATLLGKPPETRRESPRSRSLLHLLGPLRKRQSVRSLSAKSLEVQRVPDRDFGKTAFPVRGRHRDVMCAVVYGPAVAMLVAEETGKYPSVGCELLADLPAVVDVRGLLADWSERRVPALAGTANRCVVQFLMAEDNLRRPTILCEVIRKPLLLRGIDPVGADHSIFASPQRGSVGSVVAIKYDEVKAAHIERIESVFGASHLEELLLGDVFSRMRTSDQVVRGDLLVTALPPANIVIAHHVIPGALHLSEYSNVVLERFELSIVHFARRLAFADLAAEVAEINRKVGSELLHPVDEPLEVGFVTTSPSSEQMGVGIQAKPKRCSIWGRSE